MSFIEPFGYARFILPAGHYRSIEHVCIRFNKLISQGLNEIGKNMGNPPSFHYEEMEDEDVGTHPSAAISGYTDSPVLPRILGQIPTVYQEKYYGFELHKETHSLVRPELDILRSMFIYSDIIKYQTVGDVQAPLLGVLPVRGSYKEQAFWNFSPPYYIPVAKTDFDTINISLWTDTGDAFPLLPHGKVICRLHFRRKQLL